MRKAWLLAFAMLAVTRGAWAAPVKADELFDKGLFNDAIKEYTPSLNDPDESVRLKALYRTIECEALLFRYAEAAQRSLDAKLPADPLWQARFLIQRAELAREFLKQYGFAAPSEVEDGQKDVVRKTPDEWRALAREDYERLWALRKKLVDVPLRGEAYFVDLRNAEVESAPSLWDFVVLRWSGFLLDGESGLSGKKPAALPLSAEHYSIERSSADGPAAQAAALFEDAANLSGVERAGIKELWRIKRLRLAFDAAGQVEPAPDHKAFTQAAIERLKGWLETFSTPQGRAEAGLAAAERLNADQRFEETAALCRRVEKDWPALRAAKHCAKIRASIELPVLNMTAKFVAPGARDALRVNTRNLDKVFFRLFRVEPDELLAQPRQYRPEGWQVLRQADKETALMYLARHPDYEWTTDIKPPKKYAYADTSAQSPELKAGIYLAVASGDEKFAPGSSLLGAVFLNATDLFLIASAGAQGPESAFVFDPAGPASREAPVFHFYSINGLTGKPVAAHIDAFRRDRWQQPVRVSLDTDDSGRAQASAELSLIYNQGTSASFDPLAKRGNSYAYASNPLYFNHGVPAPIEIFLETDRPIYRPSQEVRVKATVLRRIPQGYKVYDGAAPLHLEARDANGQELFKKDLKLNAMGSAQAKFTIAAGRLLGSYSLSASLSDFNSGFSGWHQFQVEEYKRPEFEVEVDESSAAWKYGELARVSGKAKYYFGAAVPDAPVNYRVYREAYIPWFCWFWRGMGFYGGRTEVLSGSTKTDAQGKFSFDFTPQPQDPSNKDAYPSNFTVEAESRDPGGRTISASRTFRAGAKAYLFEITPPAGFLSAGKTSDIPVRLMNLNEKAVAGRGSFALYRLVERPKAPEAETYWGGSFLQSPSLESLYKDIRNGPLAGEGKLTFSGETAAKASLKNLAAGVYRLTLRASDPWGGESEQSIVLLAAEAGPGKKTLPLPNITIPEHASYVSGETARFLMGSDLLDGTIYVEIWGGQQLLERQVLDGGGIRILSVPVTDDFKGGFTVRWFGAKDFKIRSGEARVDVPWKDRALSVTIQHDAVMKPGQKVTWSVSARDSNKRAVSGEAVVRVFDRSLEYYVKAAAPWVSSLFGPRYGEGAAQGSLYQPWANMIPVEEGWIKKMMQLYYEAIAEPNAPMLRLNKSRLYGRRRFGMMALAEDGAGGGNGMEYEAKSMPMAAPAAAAASRADGAKDGAVREEAADKLEQNVAAKKGSAPPVPPVAARKNFAETAFFEPQLKITNGKGVFSFTAPEQLTSWKIQAYALTKDVKRGEVSAESVTRKDLMVQVEMPRYFREGDEGTIKTVVHNETANGLNGDVTLEITDDNGDGAAEKLGLSQVTQSFSAVARGVASLSWKLKATSRASNGNGYKIKAIVRSGELVDAEERDLPILPSRERLIETVIAALDGSTKTILKLPAFAEKDPTRENESMTLQIDPALALSILNSLPSLVHYPHECTEQLLDRYVPLAIMDSFYRKNPDLAAAVKKIPKRDTITPAWDRNDPRRLTQLMETPWEELSKGRKSYWPTIDMLDPKIVQGELMEALAKLSRYQDSDGGFPWFPGGRSDPYMTLLVLAGFAEAKRYDVAVPLPVVQRALGYVNNEIPKHMKPEEGEVSLILYAAYVATSYTKTTPGAEIGWKFAKVWADYADKHMEAMTPLGKAYAAYVYWRLGEKQKGDLYLDRAMDGAREDKTVGVYWTPEKISWLWYNDTVEKHSFFLRTLLTLRPKDPRIPGMVQWLLFNRKGNEWKSTKASAAAIFSLMDVLRSRGALKQGDSFESRWAGETQAAAVEPLDWLEKPLRWIKFGADVASTKGEAVIEKKGPGLAFASLTWIYTSDQLAKASGPGMMELSRRFFVRHKEGDKYHLTPLAAGETVHVGDQIEVQLKINTKSQFEYVHLKDPKIAGFEAEELLSGWKWDQLSRYEEQRDSLANFFISWLPHGEYILRYKLRPTSAGKYRLGAAVLQSMYAPEMSAHSDGFWLNIAE